jgi:hypothetical protein
MAGTPAPAPALENPFVPVTSAERKQTRPLVELVLAAHQRGDYSKLCDMMSERFLTQTFGNRDRCRRTAARPARACRLCTFRIATVMGVYLTESDRALRRKSVGWLVLVKGDPAFDGQSELDVVLRRERSRWFLHKLVAAG